MTGLLQILILEELGTPEYSSASLMSTNQKHTEFCYLVLGSDHYLMYYRHVRAPTVHLNCEGALLGESCLSDPSLQSINTRKHRNFSPFLSFFFFFFFSKGESGRFCNGVKASKLICWFTHLPLTYIVRSSVNGAISNIPQ